MNTNYSLTSASRWISFGGSYSGELAACAHTSNPHHTLIFSGALLTTPGLLVITGARIKYPHLIYAAVASSAPVSAIVDYDGYDPIVADALAYPLVGGSPECRDAVAVSLRNDDRFSVEK